MDGFKLIGMGRHSWGTTFQVGGCDWGWGVWGNDLGRVRWGKRAEECEKLTDNFKLMTIRMGGGPGLRFALSLLRPSPPRAYHGTRHSCP